MRKGFVGAIAMLVCFGVQAQLAPGSTPPNDLGHTLDGRQVSVSALHGKVVVISFWATWCGYCMKELPVLGNLQRVADEKHLPLQVVSVDSMESRQTFVHTARVLQKALPGLLITWDRRGAIGRPYGSNHGIPVMVMLHRNGTVAHVHVGYGESMLPALVEEINVLLAEPPPPANVAMN